MNLPQLPANIPLSTPHEPSRQRSLIDCFESMLTFDEDNEAEYYDSDGSGPPCVLEDEFFHFEKSLNEIIASEIATIPIPSKFVFLDDSAIDSLKADGLTQELEKRSLSEARVKAELREWLKNAMVDKISVVDTAKFSADPSNFDKNSRWKILEPTSVAEEPECKDPSLLDPTASKYSNRKKLRCIDL